MKIDTKNRITEELATTDFFNNLPDNIDDFALEKIFTETGDKFYYFNYANNNHRALTAYFHEETAEYKLRVKIGLTEFCLSNFFTGKFNTFTETLNNNLAAIIKNIFAPADTVNDILISDKNLADWNYPKTLPTNIEGFELFITPDKPMKITNGSYMILNYSDFAHNSDFTVHYNAYTDNFSGESLIKLVPYVSYTFDADNLKDLESKLDKNLVTTIQHIKKFYNA